MSLRDWLAGMAMQGFIASDPTNYDCGMEGIIHDSYLYADEMLERRKRPPLRHRHQTTGICDEHITGDLPPGHLPG